jgi:hypothetical protein
MCACYSCQMALIVDFDASFYNIYLWLYSPLLDLGRFFSFLIYTQSVGLLGRGINPSQGRYLHTEQHKQRIHAHRRPKLEWDSNPRSQRSSELRGHCDRPFDNMQDRKGREMKVGDDNQYWYNEPINVTMIMTCVWAQTWGFRLSHLSSHARTWEQRKDCCPRRSKGGARRTCS